MTRPGQFKERWSWSSLTDAEWFRINKISMFWSVGPLGARPTIGWVDDLVRCRAKELGLTVIATDRFKVEYMQCDQEWIFSVDVLCSSDGNAPIIEGEAKALADIGCLPYIHQLEHK